MRAIKVETSARCSSHGAVNGPHSFHTARCYNSYSSAMPRTVATRRRPARGSRAAHTPQWVRKNMLMDQKKLDEVKRVLKASTETEAIDAALDEIAFRHGLVEGMRALKRAG